jgi:hypothetical protein
LGDGTAQTLRFPIDQRFILEDVAGRIVGVEAKAAASVTRQDFGGLQRLASASGDAFVQGILPVSAGTEPTAL